jgi:peptidoglycan/xylan/chitin deacetylase (PgdA/CDA1 family)
MISRRLQLFLRSRKTKKKRKWFLDVWPIDNTVTKFSNNWPGWPQDKKFALILTHDVESAFGAKKCLRLKEIEETLGFRSSFNLVPQKYQVDPSLRKHLFSAGFEIGVHGLNHDGKLYKSDKIFRERAVKINAYLKKWNAVGFRSPAMHHNLEWIHDLNIQYDQSTFDTDPFEPQPDGVGTIYPFWVSKDGGQKGYVELPYTLPQDFTLFIILKEKNIDIWKRKMVWIAEKGGMVLINTHPDYMNFDGGKLGLEEYPADYYVEFLEYVKERYEGQYWHVLPREMARFWREEVVKKN